MQISFARRFKKQFQKAPTEVKRAFDNRLRLFQKDTSHSSLNNHQLSGKLRGFRSINITGDWRALYIEYSKGFIIFEELGTHSQLYK